PTLNPPPPVPPPEPGPKPPPSPEPTPVPLPLPMPPPVPGPLEGGPGTPLGSPKGPFMAIWGNLSSGGPSSVGVIGILGVKLGSLAIGGVNCSLANWGILPLEAGAGERSPPPPPPPAFFAEAGSSARYGEMSTTSWV